MWANNWITYNFWVRLNLKRLRDLEAKWGSHKVLRWLKVQ